MVKSLHEDYLPDTMAKFERIAAANSAKEGWIFGDKVCPPFLYDYLVYHPHFSLCSSLTQTLLPTCCLIMWYTTSQGP